MSVDRDSYTRPVYVRLMDEGTNVFRPTTGIPLGGDLYRLMPTPSYELDDEDWQFPPGTIVRCIYEIRDGEEILVADESL